MLVEHNVCSTVTGFSQSGSQCAGRPLKVTVNEGLHAGNFSFKFKQDKNIQYSFHYHPYSAQALSIFQITPAGIVTNIVTLDHEDEKGNEFTFTVLAKNTKVGNGSPWTNACSLTITILDRNDNSPQFKKDLYVGSIAENLPKGSIVQGLHGIYATDRDTDGNSVDSYKILPGNGWDKFEAFTQQLSGIKFLNIRTKEILDREKASFYILTVQASDGGIPRRTTRTQVRINVEDKNDCSPKFTSSEYLVSVLSTSPLATEIMKVHAVDDDLGENADIYYFFKTISTESKNDNCFTLDPHTGVVRVAKSVHFTSGNLIQRTVVAQDRGNPPKRVETVVTFELIQGYSHPSSSLAPRFAQRSYVVRIREDLPINSHILPPDVLSVVGSKFQPKFRISTRKTIPFQVDINSGLLYLAKSLDFELRRRYDFSLILTASERSIANVTVLIDDADENYNAPVFEEVNIATILNRDLKLSQFVTKVKASDPDVGIDGEINYRIDDGDGFGRFSIDEKTARIYSVPGLNWEGIRHVGLVIEARDNAWRWKTAKQFLFLTVADQQDCNPRFEKVLYRGSIRENLPPETFVAVTKARLCLGRKLEYMITDGNSRSSFKIDQYSGIVSTRKPLDREVQAQYILEITARNGSRSSKALLVVNIDDVNDCNPVFSRKMHQVEIAENRGNIKSLLCLVAKDKDYGDNAKVNYEIISGNKTLFYVDPTLGILSSESLNFEDARVHNLRIKATDHGDPPRSSVTTVEVLVKNVNDPPKFESNEITVSISEEQAVGTRVTFLPVHDEDVGKNGEFDCSYENIDPIEFGKFQVLTITDGCEIQNKVLLKWFEGSFYSLRVVVTDKASALLRKRNVITVRVKVKDLNNHDPMFLQDSYYSSVSPDTSYILTVSATDKDNGRNARIRYSLVVPSRVFQIDQRSGKLTAVRGRLSQGDHTVRVRAEDQGHPKRRSTVVCSIIVHSRANHLSLTISFSKPKPTLSENVTLNSEVTTVRTNKAGVQYRIVGGNTGQVFRVSPRGKVSVASTLDYERVREYRLVIRVIYRSPGGLKLAEEKVLSITVLDINDNEPRFTILNSPLVLNINTKILPGSIIAKTPAYDADSANTLSYTIKASSPPVPFKINPISAVITAQKSVRGWYSFTVVAEDGGTPRKRSELEVHVTILWSNSGLKIPGHQLTGVVDEGPLGVDVDIIRFGLRNETKYDLTYSITKGNYENAFCADVTGSLRAVKELDRELRDNYILSLLVNDGESSEISIVHITVNDLDDNRPQFPSDEITIYTDENTEGQKIWTFNADDRDLGNLTYGLVGMTRQTYSNVFVVDHGILMIMRTLDHEEAANHELTIVATDNASRKTFARAVVFVRDKNDNAPRFMSRAYAQRISLHAPHGYWILQTLANDKDSGLNGKISYTLHPSSKMFAVDDSTGWISVASGLTYGSFTFNITAKDHGTPRLSDTVSVRIVIEVSAGPPRFLNVGFPQGFHARVLENQATGSKVLNLTAVSQDIVTYSLYQTNVTDFTVDSITGEITTSKPLDYEEIKYYEFTVSAADRSERISLAHVRISVVNINDNKPQILNKDKNNELSCRIPRDAGIGSFLTRVQAQDLDNDRLVFSFVQNSKSALFSVDMHGNINTVGLLVGINDNIHLALIVRDNGSHVLEDTVTINIAVVNYGGNPVTMTAEVSEDTEIGKIIPFLNKVYPRYTNTRYILIYPSQPPFTVHGPLGDLVLKTKLDYEEQQNHSLTMRVQDTWNTKNYVDVDITINVKDKNDNRPEFVPSGLFNCSKKRARFKIHENAKQGSLVYDFKARDKDSGNNGKVEYQIEKCPHCNNFFFSLDANNGKLTTTGVYLEKPRYELNIILKDEGKPRKSTIGCIIVDARPWKPQFTKEEYHFEVDESAGVDARVGVVEAQGFGKDVTYELRNPSLYFSVNAVTGVLTLKSTLDYEESRERKFELNVETKNHASSTRVIIHVRDVNDCKPTFAASSYINYVPESAPVGTTVLKLHASDGDSGLNGDIIYSLDSKQFIVDSYSGVVSTAVMLDFETRRVFSVTVTAHDRGSPSQMGETQLLINIVNINDNWPMFTSQEYSCTILENAKPGSQLTTVKATDGDGDEVTYDITEGNSAGLFIIHPVTGTIQLTKHTPLLFQSYYLLNVSATDKVHWVHSVVRVNIRDINDHAPVFTKCTDYNPSVPENSPRGTTVLQVSASDEDLGTNGEVEYAIVRQQYGTKFGIDRTTGRIETKTEFDREQDRKFSILVKATDGSSIMKPEERLEGSCSIEITISDINDNYPIFERSSYTQNISEHVQIGHRIIKVKASDGDEGLNAWITYSLKKSSSLFSIEPQTGLIKTRELLVDKKKKHILTVLATDHGDPPLSSEVDVTINITESGDKPQFKQSFYEVTIPENFTKWGIVTRVTASSNKLKDLSVSYTMERGNSPNTNSLRTFDISSDGIVRLITQLDRETIPVYSLTLRAEIPAEHLLSSFATLRIIVTDVDDCDPEFSKSRYIGRVSENVATGTPVLTVSATDRDLESAIVYNMSKIGNEYFTIHPESGRIFTKQVFDREERDYYQFRVLATDGGNSGIPPYAIVTIKIADTNDQPPVFKSNYSEISVTENTGIGELVGTVTASDADIGVNAEMTYRIKKGNIDGNFEVHPDNGRIIVNGKIDYEMRSTYELEIEAWDGKHEDTTVLVITVENMNDNNPTFEKQLYEGCIEENRSTGTMVTMVTSLKATDPDAKWIKYDLSSKVNKVFRIHPDTGDIFSMTAFDREEQNTYTFEAYARDHDGNTGTTKVIIRVLDENDNTPIFLRTSLRMEVFENATIGTLVGTVEATDLDNVTSGNGKLSYEIIRDFDNQFIITSTGSLKTRKLLDREKMHQFRVTVNVSDNGKPSRSAHDDVIVIIKDVNDNSPRFSHKVYEKTIAEDAKIGLSILQLAATDRDIGMNANLSFGMKDEREHFEVNARSGMIKLTAQLDYEMRTEYKFNVIVEDAGKLSDDAMVIIKVTDVNDCPPIFSATYKYNFKLQEKYYKYKELLHTLNADDGDGTRKNKEVWYSIPENDHAKGFVVDPVTGKLSLNDTTLDYEQLIVHTFKVRATNIAYPYLYGETEVKVDVQDVNDNPPELKNPVLNILENSTVEGQVIGIGQLLATDSDPKPNGKPFSFGILSGDKNLFQLDSKTGWLSTTSNFDREEKAFYLLEVWVRDSGTPPLTNNITVRINVTDRNDNQHKEGYLELNVIEPETIPPEVPIGQVFVDDKDTDDSRYYDVLNGDKNAFTIDRLTGNIFMEKRPAVREYEFRVQVSDKNSSFHPVVCQVKINVIPYEAFSKSITLRFLNMTAVEFLIDIDIYKDIIAGSLETKAKNVDIFSIQTGNHARLKNVIDVRLAAHGSPYYAPERLAWFLKKNTYFKNVIVGYDACVEEFCVSGGCKSDVTLTNKVVNIDNGQGQAFGSVGIKVDVRCESCEILFPRKRLCRERPCVNDGVCQDVPGGYLCTCLHKNAGPNCELTTRSFEPGDWIWLPALKSCTIGTLSFEFSTLGKSGLLLTAGVRTGPEKRYDWLAIQLNDGFIRIELSLGMVEPDVFSIDGEKLNDGEWHMVEIYRNAKQVRLIIDQCNSSIVEMVGKNQVEKKSNCEGTWNITDTVYHSLDINTPVQLGGKFETYFNGGIRNVRQNGIMMDLNATVNLKGSAAGFPVIDKHCSTSKCFGNATCIASRNGFTCVCPAGFEGSLCDHEVIEQTFNVSSFITYQPRETILESYNPKFSEIQLMVRTRDEEGGPLLMIRNKRDERLMILTLMKENGSLSLECQFNLGEKNIVVKLRDTLLADGLWHHVTIWRNRNEVHLGIDPDKNPRTAKVQERDSFILLPMTRETEIILGNVESDENGFDGCMKDIRLNGKVLPHNESNTDNAFMTKSEGVIEGCYSGACHKMTCNESHFCYDKWRASDCLPRRCIQERLCMNGATCNDYAVNGVVLYKCVCTPQFHGTYCEQGSKITRIGADADTINIKLVVGLSSFVLVLVLVIIVIVCHHRYQTSGKAFFVKPRIPSKQNSNKKEFVTAEWCQPNNEESKTNNGLKNLPCSKHVHNTTRPALVPASTHPLELREITHKPLSQLPAWDIPPMIDIVLSPDSGSSTIPEDYIEDPDETYERNPSWTPRISDGSPSEIEPDDNRSSAVTWNDIEEYGRKFCKLTKNFLSRDDGRPESSISTTSNSSSVVTVVENPLA